MVFPTCVISSGGFGPSMYASCTVRKKMQTMVRVQELAHQLFVRKHWLRRQLRRLMEVEIASVGWRTKSALAILQGPLDGLAVRAQSAMFSLVVLYAAAKWWFAINDLKQNCVGPSTARLSAQVNHYCQFFVRYFYIIITYFYSIITIIITYYAVHYYVHYYCVITLLLQITTVIMAPLLRIITSVITQLLLIITSVITLSLHIFTNSLLVLPIITVIMGPLLPIIARSIICNNGSNITYYWPGQLGDDGQREIPWPKNWCSTLRFLSHGHLPCHIRPQDSTHPSCHSYHNCVLLGQ